MSEDLYPIEYEDPSHPINMIDVPEEEDDEQCSCKQSSIWGRCESCEEELCETCLTTDAQGDTFCESCYERWGDEDDDPDYDDNYDEDPDDDFDEEEYYD